MLVSNFRSAWWFYFNAEEPRNRTIENWDSGEKGRRGSTLKDLERAKLLAGSNSRKRNNSFLEEVHETKRLDDSLSQSPKLYDAAAVQTVLRRV